MSVHQIEYEHVPKFFTIEWSNFLSSFGRIPTTKYPPSFQSNLLFSPSDGIHTIWCHRNLSNSNNHMIALTQAHPSESPLQHLPIMGKPLFRNSSICLRISEAFRDSKRYGMHPHLSIAFFNDDRLVPWSSALYLETPVFWCASDSEIGIPKRSNE